MIVRHLNVDTLNIYLQMSSHFTLSLLFSSEEQYGTFYAILWNTSLGNLEIINNIETGQKYMAKTQILKKLKLGAHSEIFVEWAF